MRVKICGITRPSDAAFAEEAGADAIGVVLFSDSPRSVSVERAREIFSAVGPFTATVAVTHTDSPEDLAEILALEPDAIQISHPFARELCGRVNVIRVMRRGHPFRDDADALVVDDSMGKGRVYDSGFFRDIAARSRVPVILAGGLNPENVREAIAAVSPYAVDVASGVEDRPGIKNHEKVRRFIEICREAGP